MLDEGIKKRKAIDYSLRNMGKKGRWRDQEKKGLGVLVNELR